MSSKRVSDRRHYDDPGDYDDDYNDYDDDDYSDYEDDDDEDYGGSIRSSSSLGQRRAAPKKMSSARVRKQRKAKLVQMWAAFLIGGAVIFLILIKMVDVMYRGEPVSGNALSDKIYFDADYTIKDAVDDNHDRYFRKAYVLIEGQYQKILSGVERNDYDFKDDFYVAEGDAYLGCYKDGTKNSANAIDVSSYQGNVNWQAVKASGIDYAMIRAGYRGYSDGGLIQDDRFSSNVDGAKAAGIEAGVYFVTQAISYEEGVEEAEYVLGLIRDKGITGPVAVDTEYIEAEGVRANELSTERRTEAIVGFCETIKNAGYTPMIYASRNWFLVNLDMSEIGGYKIWLASYSETDFPYHIEGYQYTSEGAVSGVGGYCDINVWWPED